MKPSWCLGQDLSRVLLISTAPRAGLGSVHSQDRSSLLHARYHREEGWKQISANEYLGLLKLASN